MAHPLDKTDSDPRVLRIAKLMPNEPFSESDLTELQALLDDLEHDFSGCLHVNSAPEGGRIILLSKRIKAVYGYDLDIGRRLGMDVFRVFFHPDELENFSDDDAFTKDHADTWTLPSQIYRFRDARGAWYWFIGHFKPLTLTPNGMVWHYLGLAVDISGEITGLNAHHFVEHLMEQQRQAAEASISGREMEVLHLIASSFTDREVAEHLHISPHTASTHRRNLMRKLDVTNVADLVRAAVSLGLVPLKSDGEWR